MPRRLTEAEKERFEAINELIIKARLAQRGLCRFKGWQERSSELGEVCLALERQYIEDILSASDA